MEWHESKVREKELELRQAEVQLQTVNVEKEALEARIADGHVDEIDRRRHELAMRTVDVGMRHRTIRFIATCVAATILGTVAMLSGSC